MSVPFVRTVSYDIAIGRSAASLWIVVAVAAGHFFPTGLAVAFGVGWAFNAVLHWYVALRIANEDTA